MLIDTAKIVIIYFHRAAKYTISTKTNEDKIPYFHDNEQHTNDQGKSIKYIRLWAGFCDNKRFFIKTQPIIWLPKNNFVYLPTILRSEITMQRIIITFILICSCSHLSATKNEKLSFTLDSLLDNISQIYKQKEASINTYKGIMDKDKSTATLLSVYDKLFNEYYVYQFDSAMAYVDKSIELADKTANQFYHDKSRIEKASLLAIGGLYGEAMSLLNEIDFSSLTPSLSFNYTITKYYIYMYWSDYCHDATYAPKYRQKSAEFLKQAVGLLSKNDKRYNFFLGEYYIYVERNDKKALSHYFRVLKEVPVNSRYYAMAAFAIANNYSANHQPEKYEEYILQACISDLKNCTRENLALQDFAMYLYQKDNENVSRAERYINFAMDDAKAYNNRLRIIEISQKLPIIVKNYREKLTTQNNLMRAALWGISILLIIMLVLFYFFRQQNKLLHKHRIELSDSNTQLSSLNDALNLLNTRLIDTNKQRERLAKLYIDLCAKFIDRLSKFELLVRRKIKVGQVNDLLNMTSSSRLSDEDAATFLLQFDTAFLDMYPSFIEEFNALLKPEEQVKPAHSRSLTTELRIFALIRLGVKDSSEIASLLFYKPRTIYNYRSAFKNKALNRETFEEDVEKLCTVMPTTA